jgi:hypothetical protein
MRTTPHWTPKLTEAARLKSLLFLPYIICRLKSSKPR